MNKPLYFVSLALGTVALPLSAQAGNLVDLIPGLYGGDGITLMPTDNPNFPSHEAHFTLEEGAEVIQEVIELNNQIASEIRPFPVAPSSGGVTYQFDPEQGTYRQTSDTLGPFIAARPQTLGQGKLSLSVAYLNFQYDEFEGTDLSKLRARFLHEPDTLDPTDVRTSFETDVINVVYDVDLRFESLAIAATYGLTDKLDLTAIVPFVHAKMDVDATASIERGDDNNIPVDVHIFDATGESPLDSGSGSASGLGDITLAAKYYWVDAPNYDLAAALKVKLETGDEEDFLGTGSTTATPYLIGAYDLSEMVKLHANVGLEFDFEDSDRNEFQYVVGTDIGNQTYTFAADIIGRHKLSSDVDIGENIIDAAVGLKWRATDNLLLAANLIFPLNDDGLRSDLITAIGLEYRN
ncbi:MAG: transporter [Chromatiales bacterium]|nr:transporter [Chromatiales bacterium]